MTLPLVGSAAVGGARLVRPTGSEDAYVVECFADEAVGLALAAPATRDLTVTCTRGGTQRAGRAPGANQPSDDWTSKLRACDTAA